MNNIFEFIKNFYALFSELLEAFFEKIIEWAHEPLFWIYIIGTVFSFLLFSQENWLMGLIVLLLTFSIEKRKQ